MRERIKEALKVTFDLDEIPDDISQKNCDVWDSMRHLQLVIELETEFDVSFEPEDISEMISIDAIEKKIKVLM
jgi:acyl carrier protein